MWTPDTLIPGAEQLLDANGDAVQALVVGAPYRFAFTFGGGEDPTLYDTFRVEDEDGDALLSQPASHGPDAVYADFTAPANWKGRRVRLGFVRSADGTGVGGSYAFPVVAAAP